MSTDFNIELVPAKNPALHSIAEINPFDDKDANWDCLLYTSPSPRD